MLDDLRERPPFEHSDGATLWDGADGVAVLEFHTKANALDERVLDVLELTAARFDGRYRAVVVYNEGRFFSTGGDLARLRGWAGAGDAAAISAFVRRGQAAFNGLKYAPFPVVGAPAGHALGGGCEVLLHCDAVQAHSETFMGLVERGVGLLPAWGGCKELLQRMSPQAAFELIAGARMSRSAADAQELGYLRDGDRITADRAALLADARRFALELAAGYAPPAPPLLAVGPAALEPPADASPYDRELCRSYAWVLTGGEDADHATPVPEWAISDREREAIGALLREPRTLERIDHMLETGKPLRN